MEMLVKQCKSQDELFNKSGFTNEELNRSIKELNLEKDPEFLKVVQENMFKVMAKAKKAEMNENKNKPA